MSTDGQPSTWDDDKILISTISMTNPKLGRYALRLIDIDAGRAEELPVPEQAQLGVDVVNLGEAIQRRAERRQIQVQADAVDDE